MEGLSKYKGVIVPMVSPLDKNHAIDTEAVGRIAGFFVEAGVKPFVLGTTGEAVSLPVRQREILVEATVKAVNKRTTVLAGIIGNSLYGSIDEGNMYASLGVDAVVATIPNYYPSNRLQMHKYLTSIADSVKCPVILYNTPGTNHRSIPVDLIEELSCHPNIIGVKDSERDTARLNMSVELWGKRSDFVFLIGWAAMSAYGLSKGAHGIVPSTGNFVPGMYYKLYKSALYKNVSLAEGLQEKTNSISAWYQQGRDLSHSIPALKQIMAIKKLCNEYVAPPMYELCDEEKASFIKKIGGELQKLND